METFDLVANYYKQRENKILFADPKGRGFLTYRILEDAFYIIDIYVAPEFRQTGVAREMADVIAKEALEKGITSLLGSVSPNDPSATDNMKTVLAYGMKFFKNTPELIYFVKNLTPENKEDKNG